MVTILDKSGQFLEETTNHGYVRKLLKSNKAKVVQKEPFTIQLVEDSSMKDYKSNLADIILANITILCGEIKDKKVKYDLLVSIYDFIDKGREDCDTCFTMLDLATYLFSRNSQSNIKIGEELLKHKDELSRIGFDVSDPEESEEPKELPVRAYLNLRDDLLWNFIPLGVTVDKYDNKLKPIGWYLNDQNYDGRSIYSTIPSTSLLIVGGVGSGTSIVERSIINHINAFRKDFTMIGVDVSCTEFSNRDNFDILALNRSVASSAAVAAQKVMMKRFKLMEKFQKNNIYKVNGSEVDYYEIEGKSYQFDELLTVKINNDDVIIPVEDLHCNLYTGVYKTVIFNGKQIGIDHIKRISGQYKTKAIVLMFEDLHITFSTDDNDVANIKQAIGSIARLGRASGVHLVLKCSEANSKTISTDLKNNIQSVIVLGGFDSHTSNYIFEEDISNLSKPSIKGRGFMMSGNDIAELQIYEGKITNF